MGWQGVIRNLLCGAVICVTGFAAQAQEARAPSKGQTLYLPIYSHMLYGNLGKSGKASYVRLSALISIRNTDAGADSAVWHPGVVRRTE